MKFKNILLVLSAISVLSMTSCGKNTNAGSKANNSGKTVSTSSSDKAVSTESSEKTDLSENNDGSSSAESNDKTDTDDPNENKNDEQTDSKSEEALKYAVQNEEDDIINNMFDENGLTPLCHEVTNKWGFVNNKGEWVIEPTFGMANPFSEGLAFVRTEKDENGKPTCGFIDSSGNLKLQFSGSVGGDFSQGYAAMMKDGKYGYIDKDGNWVIEPQYDSVSCFYKDNTAMVKLNDSYFYIDKNGDQLGKNTFKHAGKFSEGLACVSAEENGLFGYIDLSGELVIDYQFEKAGEFHNGIAEAVKNSKSGFIDSKGNTVVDFKFDNIRSFYDGLAAVCIDKKWGAVDRDFNIVIETKYNAIGNFHDGVAFAWEDNINTVINKRGDTLFKLEKGDNLTNFCDGTALIFNGVSKNFKVVDKTGTILKSDTLPEKENYDAAGVLMQVSEYFGTSGTYPDTLGLGKSDKSHNDYYSDGYTFVGLGGTHTNIMDFKGNLLVKYD